MNHPLQVLYALASSVTLIVYLRTPILFLRIESWQSKSIHELKMKFPPNKLYSTERIELLSTIGQGTV